MVYLLGEISILLALAALLGLIVGWLLWRWRQGVSATDHEAVLVERKERDRTIGQLTAEKERQKDDILAVRSQSDRATADRDSMEDRLTRVLIENSRLVEQREDLVRQVTHVTTSSAQAAVAAVPLVAAEQVADHHSKAGAIDEPADIFNHEEEEEETYYEQLPSGETDQFEADKEIIEPIEYQNDANSSFADPVDEEQIDLTHDEQIDLADTSTRNPVEVDVEGTEPTIVKTLDIPIRNPILNRPMVATDTAATTADVATGAGTAIGVTTVSAVAAEVASPDQGRLGSFFSSRGDSSDTPDTSVESADASVFSSKSGQTPHISSKPAVDSPADNSAVSDGSTSPRQDSKTVNRDDLTQIDDIGSAMEIFLHNQDIWTFRQLGNLTETDVDNLQSELPRHPGIIRDQDWVGQARRLYNEKIS